MARARNSGLHRPTEVRVGKAPDQPGMIRVELREPATGYRDLLYLTPAMALGLLTRLAAALDVSLVGAGEPRPPAPGGTG